jgi:hypothetical protein
MFRYPDDGRVGAVRRPERVVDVDVGECSKLLRELRVVVFLASVEANVLQQQDIPGLQGIDGGGCLARCCEQPLQVGQRLVFNDMAHYTMVKTSTFNGTQLPAIALWNSLTDELEVVREFGFNDFRERLS